MKKCFDFIYLKSCQKPDSRKLKNYRISWFAKCPLWAFLGVLMLTGCDNFNVKKTSSEAILNEELQTFNWNDVDEYPSFSVCESSISKAERKVCFHYTLTNHITNYLQNEVIVVSRDIHDTLMLQFQVSKQGNISLMKADIDSITAYEIPEIKGLLQKSLDSLPQIFPAIKRGQQVTSEFNLPLIIKVN